MSGAPRRLLVGVDGTPAAAAALRRAVRLAHRNHGTLVLVCVVPPFAPIVVASPLGMCSPLPEDPREGAAEILRDARRSVPDGVSVLTLVQAGRVGPALADVARRHTCDTIVIGAHRGLWNRLTGGTERHLRRCAETKLLVERVPSTPDRARDAATPAPVRARAQTV